MKSEEKRCLHSIIRLEWQPFSAMCFNFYFPFLLILNVGCLEKTNKKNTLHNCNLFMTWTPSVAINNWKGVGFSVIRKQGSTSWCKQMWKKKTIMSRNKPTVSCECNLNQHFFHSVWVFFRGKSSQSLCSIMAWLCCLNYLDLNVLSLSLSQNFLHWFMCSLFFYMYIIFRYINIKHLVNLNTCSWGPPTGLRHKFCSCSLTQLLFSALVSDSKHNDFPCIYLFIYNI